jgi:hypothetical protein
MVKGSPDLQQFYTIRPLNAVIIEELYLFAKRYEYTQAFMVTDFPPGLGS